MAQTKIHKTRNYLIFFGLLLVVFLVFRFALDSDKNPEPATTGDTDIEADIKRVKNLPADFDKTKEFFISLAHEKGALHAFDILIKTPLPSNVDSHLIGHEVGDILYEQKGLEGMEYCTHDLRNACAHSVVIGALLDKGEAIFETVNEICHQAPGGTGAYSLCFHGLGHGVLAYSGYEVPEAIKLCSKVKNESHFREEEIQCIGGVVMEMNIGAHDPATWEAKKEIYLTKDKPLRICEEDYMPKYAKTMCYSYATPYIFAAAELSNEHKEPERFAKAFAYCDGIENKAQRKSCYGGLGKEFVTVAQNGDTRIGKVTTDEELNNIILLCSYSGNDEAFSSCINTSVDTLYWGGENDPQISVRMCGLLDEGETRDSCFEHLFVITRYYQQDPDIRKSICESVVDEYSEECNQTLLFNRADFR